MFTLRNIDMYSNKLYAYRNKQANKNKNQNTYKYHVNQVQITEKNNEKLNIDAFIINRIHVYHYV